MSRNIMLMGVFNPIEFDTRVQRCCEALSEQCQLTLYCLAPSEGVTPFETSQYKIVRLKPFVFRPFQKGFLFVFWVFWFFAALRIKADKIYAHDYYLAFPGALIKTIKGGWLCYDAHELLLSGQGKELSLRDKFFRLLEKLTIHVPDLIVTANEERALKMKEVYRLKSLPLTIQNFSSFSSSPLPLKGPFFSKPEHEIWMIYSGDIDYGRGLLHVIRALPHLPGYYKLMLVGDGPDADDLKQKLKDPFLAERVSYAGRVRGDVLPSYLQAADIGIVLYSFKGWNQYYCAPNKVHEYLLSGLPVLCSANPLLEKWVKEYSIGEIAQWNSEKEAPEAIAAVVLKMSHKKECYQGHFKRFLHDHSWENEKNKLLSALNLRREKER